MPRFPNAPVPPGEVLEGFLAGALGRRRLPRPLRELGLCLGLRLVGRGGGEWQIHLREGDVEVVAAPRRDAPLSLVQSVDDWQGALWEGRGGPIGCRAAAFFRNGAGALPERAGEIDAAALEAAVARLAGLDALLRLELREGEGDEWRIDLRLGAGALPAQPTTTVRIAVADAEALVAGELKPLEAFMAGRVQLDGDVALLLRIQGSLSGLRS